MIDIEDFNIAYTLLELDYHRALMNNDKAAMKTADDAMAQMTMDLDRAAQDRRLVEQRRHKDRLEQIARDEHEKALKTQRESEREAKRIMDDEHEKALKAQRNRKDAANE